METNKQRVERLYKECRMEAFTNRNEVHPQGHPLRRMSSIYASIDKMDDSDTIPAYAARGLLDALRWLESMVTKEEEERISEARCSWNDDYIKACVEMRNESVDTVPPG